MRELIDGGRRADVHPLTVAAVDAEDLDGLVVRRAEPALVRAELALARGRDDDLPDVEPARLLRQRKDHAAVADARLEPDSRVADVRGADELVERNLMGFGKREEQLEAGLALTVLEP